MDKSININLLQANLEKEFGTRNIINVKTPYFIKENLRHGLREYQEDALKYFIAYDKDYVKDKNLRFHVLFNMATGSGKTLMMATLILYLYEKGYRNFLFFVNSSGVIEKTKCNFLNLSSNKYLFKDKIEIKGKQVEIRNVLNFQSCYDTDAINLCITTIQKLHSDIIIEKENKITMLDFKDTPIVLIADEAHHFNTETKSMQKNMDFGNIKPNWENTVMNIFNVNDNNILLEFTATIDLKNSYIKNKYLDKIIFQYDLKKFREDKYSKEIKILKCSLSNKELILQAILVSQYKQDIAIREGKIGPFKPVILFKSQNIEKSNENNRLFNEIVDKLSFKDIEDLRLKTVDDEDNIIKNMYIYFKNSYLSLDDLIDKLKSNFRQERTLNMNNDLNKDIDKLTSKEKAAVLDHSHKLNSLEENEIRAVFVVNKLDEGWDVLNLFDIVRLYETRVGTDRINHSTVSEAQLIGRGARYYPFEFDEYDKYKRKFDDEVEDNELKLLETLHYHSFYDSKFINDLKRELKDQGLIEDEKVYNIPFHLKKDLNIKPYIYTNKRIKRISEDYIKMTEGLKGKIEYFEYKIKSGIVEEELLYSEDDPNALDSSCSLLLSKIDVNIIRNAFLSKGISFEKVKKYYNLSSMKEFIKYYLGNFYIRFIQKKKTKPDIRNKDILDAISDKIIPFVFELLNENEKLSYCGSTEWKSDPFKNFFGDPKVLKRSKKSEYDSAKEMEEYLKDKSWFVQNTIDATSYEKKFIEDFSNDICPELKTKFNTEKIFLIRNELQVPIYDYREGRKFYPDFLLLISGQLTHQIFIEIKGELFKEKDEWKEKFLIAIKDRITKVDKLDCNIGNKYDIRGLQFIDDKTSPEEILTWIYEVNQ
nr:DEAD/DEAH box helicase family protein [Borrelia sp. BU AG58]